MKKKLAALFLALALLLSLSACGGSPSSPDTPSNPSDAPASADSTADKPAASNDLVTLKILCKNDFSSETKTADWEKYDISQTFKEKLAELGIQLEVECIANDNFANVVNTRMAAGVDMPDIISVAFEGGINMDNIVSWGQNGLIIPASKLMEEYDTDGSIAAYWDKYAPGTRGAQTAPDGNLYWFAYLYSQDFYSKETGERIPAETFRLPSIRQDWVEAVGEEVKLVYSADELFDLLMKFQDQDVNGNGLKDEVACVQISSFYDNLARGFGLRTDQLAYIDENGKVQSNFYDPNLTAYLEFMKKLYDNGLYDTSAFSSDQFSSELITSNKAAITFNYATWSDYEKQIAVDGVQYTPFIFDADGDLSNGWYAQGDNASMTFNQHFVTSSCKHPEAAAKLFDFVYSDEYARLCAGIEGLTYTLDEKGVLNPIDLGPTPTDPDELEAFKIKYTSLIDTSMGLYGLPCMRVFPSYVDEVNPNNEEYIQVKERALKEIKSNMDTCDFQPATPLAISTEEENERMVVLTEALSTYSSEMLSDMILGERDISTLPEGVAELEKLGLKELMDITQARYDRAMAGME